MDNIPQEILCVVFWMLLPDRSMIHSSYPDKLRFSAASICVPLTISHVCRSWREAALSYGDLWSHLLIVYSRSHIRKRQKTIIEIFEVWLSRTNGSPINFSFHCGPSGSYNEEAQRGAEYIILVLLSQRYRWKDVDFEWHALNPSGNFPRINLTDMPLLSSLVLSVRTQGPERMTTVIDISKSSRLVRLDLRGEFRLECGQGSIYIEMESSRIQFASNCSASSSVLQSIEFLKAAPNMTDLHGRFGSQYDVDSLHPERDIVVSYNLRNLLLESSKASALFINNATLPSLKALSYACAYHESGGSILLSFVQRSLPPLTYLAVGGDVSDEEKLIPVLRLLPTLQDLRIMNGRVSSLLFRELTVTGASSETETRELPSRVGYILCPALRSLRVPGWRLLGPRDLCIDALITMLKSRSQVLRSFKSACACHTTQLCVNLDDPKLDWDVGSLNQYFMGWGLYVHGHAIPSYPFKGRRRE